MIIVGILRVLLSSCPNTKKNTTGGVCIHREWSSCVKLYELNKDEFDRFGFQSKLFNHETMEKDLKKKKEIEERSQENLKEEWEPTKDDDVFDLPEYLYENDRHRIITAMIISDFFIFMLKHFKANCIN